MSISSHEKRCYIFGCLSALVISPLLVADPKFNDLMPPEHHEHHNNEAIQSNLFQIFVYCTLVVGLVLSLEFTIDLISNRLAKNHLLVRLCICATLVITSAAHIYLSCLHDCLIATWAIHYIRAIMTILVGVHQIFFRQKLENKLSIFCAYSILFFWNIGTIFLAYANLWDVLRRVGSVFRFIGVLITMLNVCRHIYMIVYDQLGEGWYEQRQQATFEVLACCMCSLAIFLTLYYWEPDSNLFGYPEILLSITCVAFLALLSSVITDEYRYNYDKVNNKLNMKSIFVRHVSHEIRTPLNCCMLGIKYLQSSILKPSEYSGIEAMEILDEITEGCNTALDFVNNLLMYEKIDTVELPLYLKREDLSMVCRQVHKSFTLSARELGVQLHLNIHDFLQLNSNDVRTDDTGGKRRNQQPIVHIDGPKIAIVLRNLISNALKFTPKNGTVTIAILPVNVTSEPVNLTTDLLQTSNEENVTHYRVIVSDTGKGMSAEEQKQLFTKIVQFSPNENQKGGGSGIGLFLSHHIMKEHNLKILVTSKGVAGEGTHFIMDFPRHRGRRTFSNSTDPVASGSGEISPRQQNIAQSLMSFFGRSLPRIEAAECHEDEDDDDEGSISPSDKFEQFETFEDVANANMCRSADDAATCWPSISSSSMAGEQNDFPLKRISCTFDIKTIEELKILIVDDSSLNRKMIVRTLKQNSIGSSYENLSDGVELLTEFEIDVSTLSACIDLESGNSECAPLASHFAGLYDVILLDDHMAQMNGSTAIRILRQRGYKGLVVGLTGSALEEDLNAFCAAGVDYALPKPFQVDNFVSIVQRHMLLV